MAKPKVKQSSFRFATDILRRLGEELNPSPDQGLLELVKNSYDADARTCTVELEETSVPGGSVRICDDGDGMDASDIVNGWLVLGKSAKSAKRLTRLKRIAAGNKGLGRLAALRMGSAAEMATRPRKNKSAEHYLKIDWERFDDASLVEDVTLRVTERERADDASNGTDITITGLREKVSRWDVKRLARAMILLADPFDDDPSSFKPRLVSKEYTDLESLVTQRYFSEADYKLTATVRNGKAIASVSDSKGRSLFKAKHSDLIHKSGKERYACPDASFDFWAFILTKSTFETRSVSLAQVREWLGSFGGVHLYHNGLRVSPYGNPGHDWLDINLMRTRSPEERPGTNTSIGKVTVVDRSAKLVQKTDRSGFIETEEFADLRIFAMDALDWMARRRLEIAEIRRAAERAKTRKRTVKSKKDLETAIKESPKSVRTKLEQAAAAYDRSREREVDRLRKEVQLYRTLATAGIMAATFAHESSGSPIKVIRVNIGTVRRRSEQLLPDQFEAKLEKPIERIETATQSLGVLGVATLNLLNHEKRRLGKVEVNKVISKVCDTYSPFLTGRGVMVEQNLCSGNPYFRGSDAAFESVVTNLLSNSIAFFEHAGTADRKIVVTTEIVEDVLVMGVKDNGPGIEGIDTRDIWLPGHSTRSGGTGLGLTIVKDTVLDAGGKVDATSSSDLGGAELVIELPIIGT